MISISPAAIAEINRIKNNKDISDSYLRLSVRSGGCLDLFYSMDFENTDLMNRDSSQETEGHLVEVNGVSLIIEQDSWQYIEHLQLDYSEDLMGGGFRFNNPQTKQSCGCGLSFSI